MPWTITLSNAQILAVHASLLPSGKVLYFGGSEHNPSQNESGNAADLDNSRLYDPAGPSITTIGSPDTDVFCAGHSILGDGRLLVAGGTSDWGDAAGHGHHEHNLNFLGERAAWIYHPRANRWLRVRDMSVEPGSTQGGGRWYPSLLTLGNGDSLAVAGHPLEPDSRHNNDTPERYSPGSDHWTSLDSTRVAAGERDKYYPRIHLLPDGNVFFATPSGGNCRVYDAMAGAWVGSGLPAAGLGNYDSGWDYTSVLLPLLPNDGYRARVMVCGDERPRFIEPLATGATWSDAGTRALAGNPRRRFVCSVLLPTGDVFVTGGVATGLADAAGVLVPEIYHPGIDWTAGTHTGVGTWEALSADPATVVRNYHSTALLLPDGRVWTAGSSKGAAAGDPGSVAEMRIETFAPAYVAAANRPQIIEAPASVGYGQTFAVRASPAADIDRVVLIRAGSSTHGFDADQRYIVLAFTHTDGDRLEVTAPPHGAVAPPGHYMLWLLDDAGRPCQLASLVRVCDQQIFIVTDRSTFSTHEVQALGGSASFANAFYVVLDGFLPHEVGTPLINPTFEFRWTDGGTVAGLRAEVNRVLYEDDTVPPDIAQRITFACNLRFDNDDAFDAIASDQVARDLVIGVRHGGNAAVATLTLSKNPNPYMRDGAVHWLSTDLRVFALRTGQPMAGRTLGAGGSGAITFIRDLLTTFDGIADDEDHPFRAISIDAEQSRLYLGSHTGGQPVYNFAVAKVRYRAPIGVDADATRVFFRLFTTAATGLAYTSEAYPRVGDGASAVPMLGVRGGAILSLPFFAEARVADMRNQSDLANRKDLEGDGADEVVAYFGCWLDFNQPDPRFPLSPTHDGRNGPFTGTLLSLQELLRNDHCCLAAEVHHPLDPIPANATPGSHENLAQRNLVVVPSDNPGSAATHTVQSTFEVPASAFPMIVRKAIGRSTLPDDSLALAMDAVGVTADELLIRWNDVPHDSRATLFLPGVDVERVVRAAAQRGGPPRMTARDGHTLVLRVGGVTWIPVPGPADLRIPGLLEVELPPTVTAGERFSISVHQVTAMPGRGLDGKAGRLHDLAAVNAASTRLGIAGRKVIGAFQLDIPVRHAGDIVEAEVGRLAVLRHVARAIPVGDRWHPVFVRYLGGIEDRVRGFGVDPAGVPASPTGDPKSWTPRPDPGGGEGHGKPRAVEGYVRALEFDGCGRLQRIDLESCEEKARLEVCGRGVEELLLRACRDRLRVRVQTRGHEIVSVVVICC